LPTYNFIDTETNEEFEVVMKIAEREEFLKENPQIQPVLSAPALISGTGSYQKVPDGFKEVLAKVGEAHPDSKLGREYGNKTNAQVKARDIVEKYRKKIKTA
jgi:predicted nucleic acid-binding Zn ribbon protein